MSISVDDIKDFHLDSTSSVVMLETLEINHSQWPQPLRYVINHDAGVTVTLEDNQSATFEFMPLVIKHGNSSDDLDQSLSITVNDLGEVVPPLIRLIRDAATDERPKVIYRSFAFDVATMQLTHPKPIEIIKGLEITKTNRDYQGTTGNATAPTKNSVKTGRIYDLVGYPDLKGLL